MQTGTHTYQSVFLSPFFCIYISLLYTYIKVERYICVCVRAQAHIYVFAYVSMCMCVYMYTSIYENRSDSMKKVEKRKSKLD